MSLCPPCRLTPASVPARRRGALKPVGPRTVPGRAGVGSNALQPGLDADPFRALSSPNWLLIRPGYDRQELCTSRFEVASPRLSGPLPPSKDAGATVWGQGLVPDNPLPSAEVAC
jgi:hypothetical protein